EIRIAPATFFVSPVSVAVTDAAGANAQDTAAETAAATKRGGGVAVPLNTGDKLVFDANANLKADGGDIVLVSVQAGKAMAIFVDGLNVDGRLDYFEFRGLSVSDEFKGKVNADGEVDIV